MDSAIEINHVGEIQGLVPRILAGEVFVFRRALQQLGLFEQLMGGTLDGIRGSAGPDTAANIQKAGLDRVHEFVKPSDLPALTDAVYKVLSPMVHGVVKTLVAQVFPDGGSYYYERDANVRFHIPFDLAARHRREFDKFAETRGQGKIAAHGPHRDGWVDCPDNVVNFWVALGPVQRGNGLTIYTEDYRTEFAFKGGYVDEAAQLHKPLSFDLAPGDAVLFHSNHLHGSELNVTGRTRSAISFRIAFGKPHYPHGHYHHYLHGGMADGPFKALAAIPQNLQGSFIRYQFRRLRYKLTGRGRMSGADAASVKAQPRPVPAEPSVALSHLPVGAIRPVAKNACVARISEHEFVGLSRYCTHAAGDLTGGWVEDGQVVCPMHCLSFDPATGKSPCETLKPLRRYPVTVTDGIVRVDLGSPSSRPEAELVSVVQGR
jgi:nitrite reductase/ring-hydroxylating ferredoxin subunit